MQDECMRHNLSLNVTVIILVAGMTGACDKIGLGNKAPVPDGAPDQQQLAAISYMSSANSGAKGRKLYSHYEEAKTCGDFELALRWNRPPNVEGGPFQKKMVYLTTGIPADLPKDSEVFITATIERGETMPSGSAGWSLKMQDGSRVQAIETSNFWEKEEQAAQSAQPGGTVAIVKPEKPGRTLCAQGVYEGRAGKAADQEQKIPLVSVMFAMDRDR
jgi:hypothetical protein